MMAAPKQMMQTKRRHVIDHGFTRFKHDSGDRRCRGPIVGERHRDPFVRDRLRIQFRIPGEAPKCVPIRLEKIVSGPIAIRPGVGNAHHSGDFLLIEASVHNFGHSRSLPLGIGVRIKKLAPHRGQEDEVI